MNTKVVPIKTELAIEAALVPHRRGQLYRIALDQITAMETRNIVMRGRVESMLTTMKALNKVTDNIVIADVIKELKAILK